MVLLWFDKSFKVSLKPVPLFAKLNQLSSIRASAIHICTPDTLFYRFRTFVATMRNPHNRLKLKVHTGKLRRRCTVTWFITIIYSSFLLFETNININNSSNSNSNNNNSYYYYTVYRYHRFSGNSVELGFILQGYGIPVHTIPITYTGTVKLHYMKKWMRLRQFIEEPMYDKDGHIIDDASSSRLSVIECPYLNDIIFRQGTSIMNHPGNATFRALIAAKYKNFDSDGDGGNNSNTNSNTNSNSNSTNTKPPYKTRVFVEEVMEDIKKMNGRVLKWDDEQGCWKVLEDESQIYVKVEYLVRDFRNAVKARKVDHRQSSKRTTTKEVLGTSTSTSTSK